MCVSATDSRLLSAINRSAPGAASSPFVIAIENGGIQVLPGIINGVILTSAYSAGKLERKDFPQAWSSDTM